MLIIKDGKILAISRRHNKTKFGLPGGKKEENETPQEAAIRETFEETGVKVKYCKHFFTRTEPKECPTGEDFLCYCFYAWEWEGEPHNSEEGEVAWLTEEELTGDKGAFADYNRRTLITFRTLYPDKYLLPNARIGE
jgi:8-oxo-dGTP diphosphatase